MNWPLVITSSTLAGLRPLALMLEALLVQCSGIALALLVQCGSNAPFSSASASVLLSSASFFRFLSFSHLAFAAFLAFSLAA